MAMNKDLFFVLWKKWLSFEKFGINNHHVDSSMVIKYNSDIWTVLQNIQVVLKPLNTQCF